MTPRSSPLLPMLTVAALFGCALSFALSVGVLLKWDRIAGECVCKEASVP